MNDDPKMEHDIEQAQAKSIHDIKKCQFYILTTVVDGRVESMWNSPRETSRHSVMTAVGATKEVCKMISAQGMKDFLKENEE